MPFYSFTGNLNGWHRCQVSDYEEFNINQTPTHIQYKKLTQTQQTVYLKNYIQNLARGVLLTFTLLTFEAHDDGRMHAHGIIHATSDEYVEEFKRQYFDGQKYSRQNYLEHHHLNVKCDELPSIPRFNRWMMYCLKDQYIVYADYKDAPHSTDNNNDNNI